MKNKYLLLLIFVFFFSHASFANHIVGGSLTYERTGNLTYRITLTLYRDCAPLNTGFPTTVEIPIVRADGSIYTNLTMTRGSISSVPQNIDTCIAKSTICLQVTTYTKSVTLLANVNGYHLYNREQCCRNPALINIENPKKSGETFYTYIPNPGATINSSPNWLNPIPVFVCQGKNMNVAFGATDVDGDSLHYSFYTPYDTNKITFPGNVFTPTPVTWQSTYGANNPLNENIPNSLKINNQGIISGIPPTIGLFLVGVRCEEFRNGIKIGEILRDFQLNVVSCPPIPEANFTFEGACKGTQVSFTNTTNPNAKLYYWNFGDNATLADTSHLKSPSYNYPSLGSYTVTLITNKSGACADTSVQTVQMPSLKAAFTHQAFACEDKGITFNDHSTLNPPYVIDNWDWNFGDNVISGFQNPTHTYTAGNVYVVTLIVSAAGCKDTLTSTINIQNQPQANAGNDTARCANNAVINLNGSTQYTSGAQWLGTGSFSPNNATLNAVYTPTIAAINKGIDSLSLITTVNGLCPADTDIVIISFYKGPTIDVGNNHSVCKNISSIPVCAITTLATGVTWNSTGTGTYTNPANLCTTYIPSIADKTAGYLTLYATTTGNGNCIAVSDSLLIIFDPVPLASITSKNYVCDNQPVAVSVNVSSNAGTWSSSGTGTFVPNNTSLNGIYSPSAADLAVKSLTITFTSANNGNCSAAVDTIHLTLLEAPQAAYSTTNVCLNKPVLYTDGSTPPEKINSWKWDFGDSSSATSKNPAHVYNTVGPYNVTLIVTSKNTCTDTITKLLYLYNNPMPNFKTSESCLKDSVAYTDLSTLAGDVILYWYWKFDDGSTSILQNPTHKYSVAGSHLSMLKVTSAHYCIDSITKPVLIANDPVADFTADNDMANTNQAINFTDHSIDAVSWDWDFGDFSGFSNLQHPSYHFEEAGIYKVCLRTANIIGCKDTLCKTEIITVKPGVPSAFTPNNDGKNDVLLLYGGPFKKLIFKIYNNWGQLIFESDNQSLGWDGKYKGAEQPMGVYVYTLYYFLDDEREHQLSGDITLIR